jgi:hypothetical protein
MPRTSDHLHDTSPKSIFRAELGPSENSEEEANRPRHSRFRNPGVLRHRHPPRRRNPPRRREPPGVRNLGEGHLVPPPPVPAAAEIAAMEAAIGGEPGVGAAAPPAEMREFAFNELIGLEGPLITLFENGLTVVLTIGYAFL